MADQVKKPLKITETVLRECSSVTYCYKNDYRADASNHRQDG